MALSNLSQVLIRNIDELACSRAVLVNFPVDHLHQEWLATHPECQLHYFTNNKLAAGQLAQLSSPQLSYSFAAFMQASPANPKPTYDLAVIAFPKSKAELAYSLAMLAPYLTDDARLLFVGENKGGIKSVAKLSQSYVSNCHKLDSARHCSLYVGQFIAGDYHFSLEEWFHYYPLTVNGVDLKIAALPGVFSQKNLDKGTQVLLENLPADYRGKILDFGCGAGVISAYIAKQFNNIEICALDISALAVASTQQTLAINNLIGDAIASDGLAEVSGKYDHIVTNPPFHQGLKTHYAATEQFLRQCPKYLAKSGTLTVVANSFLKYQPMIKEGFNMLSSHANIRGFTIYYAQKHGK